MKRLVRPKKNREIAGVCAALGNYFGIDPTIVRIIYVFVSLLLVAFPGAAVYVILWLVIPEEGEEEQEE